MVRSKSLNLRVNGGDANEWEWQLMMMMDDREQW